MVALPRLVVAAPASGHGKTTVASGLMAALRGKGLRVSGHKVGPDYIDPGYHALATGRSGRNLDPHLVGEALLGPLLLHGARTPVPADVAVVEGVMGLFDGALGREGFASTAHVATALGAPVVLVVDVSHASRSVAAVVHGLATFDARVHVAGVILNQAGSARHADEVVAALRPTGVPVLGVLHRDDAIAAPSRHLGLVPVAERDDARAALDRLAAQVAARVDLEHLLRVAGSAPPLRCEPWDPAAALGPAAREPDDDAPVVAVAGGRAFTFRYTETDELIRAAGLRIQVFDPLVDDGLPVGTTGLYLGGGFPQVHATGLGANEPGRTALGAAVRAGVPTVAECAGLLHLCRSVDGFPMVGAVDAVAAMSPRLTLGYRSAVAAGDTLVARAGEPVTSHEFHRTTVTPRHGVPAAWTLDGHDEGFSADPAGLGRPTLLASYLHVHWAGHPQAAARFAAAVRATARTTAPHAARPRVRSATATAARRPVVPAPRPADVDLHHHDLHHHGDREVAAGLVDLAVNVHAGPRPTWLDDALRESLADVGRYPDASGARRAVADRHGRAVDDMLLTAGAAEAFTLVARMRRWQRPVVVHPQFTEPEAALRAAGHAVHRVLLRPDDGFRLDPALVPADADLVVVGNPTNPTGTLHPAATLAGLARPGRVLVVDEAFMDAVPGEVQSLPAARLPGLVVLRSLTKTWSIPGVRAGYLLADADTVAALALQQPPWSVSAAALAALVACTTPRAVAEGERRARRTADDRAALVAGLAEVGLPVCGDPVTPFVLARGPVGLRESLRRNGFAARRGDTFPGLGPEWMRFAVRDAGTTRRLVAAVARCLPEVTRGTG